MHLALGPVADSRQPRLPFLDFGEETIESTRQLRARARNCPLTRLLIQYELDGLLGA